MKKTKDQVQFEANTELDNAQGRGIVVMATGTGKSKIPIDRAKRKYDPMMKILIIVPTEKLRDINWRNEFEKWGALHIYETNVERACYVSANKIEGQSYDMVILDEVHNITENNSRFFQQNNVKEVIGLTATMPTDFIKREILKSLRLRPVYHVSIDEAVEWGLISPFEIIVVESKLDTVNKIIKAGNKQRPFMQTEYEAYHYLTRKIDWLIATQSNPGFLKTMILKRMRLIYTLESKSKIAEFILNNIIPKEERTLIFCGGIEQAERLNPYSFHSKSNSVAFDKFKSEEIERLSCVNSLNEGHNLPNVDNALVVQLNSKELHLVQRIGRTVRYRNGHIAKIYIQTVKDTVDEKWTWQSLANFNPSNIKTVKFEELKLSY